MKRVRGRRRGVVGRALADPTTVVGAAVVLLVVAVAVFAAWVSPYGANQMNFSATLQGPSWQHWFGTDELGRDMLSRVIYGARASLGVGIGSALLAGLLGVSVGLIAGLTGGRTDTVLMRVMDVFFAFPAILLALTLVIVLGTDLRNIVIALGVIYMPQFARVARAATLAVREEQFVEAATAIGNRGTRVALRHVLPNILSPITVQLTVTVAYAMLAEAGLSFVGLGIQPPEPSWGAMLNSGKTYLEQYPHLTIFPGGCIMLAVFGFNFLGDGLRDLIDPRMRRGR
ncbi:MAG TPA: ABC transporter permease [Trueperaceae bacterium]|nr:ABC transporter permease [Trueperaceae bacterium]